MNQEIIIILHSLAVGGAERRLSTFANYAAKKGYSVTILLIDNPTVKFDIAPEIKVVCVNQNPGLSQYDESKCELFKVNRSLQTSFGDKLKLREARIFNKAEAKYLEAENWVKYNYSIPVYEYIKSYPDAIVASFMTFPNLALMMAAKKLPNRCLFGDCTFVKEEFPEKSPYNEMRRRYFPRANGAMFQTPDQREYYTFLPDVPKSVVPNFIKSESLPYIYAGERRKDIVNFCRLSEPKNLPMLVEAFSLIHKEYPDFTLSIIGEGPEKEKIKKQIIELNLEKSAKIYDFDLNVHEKIRDAAMFVLSSYREGISNSMLEAMAIGMPCVCTDCVGGGARMMIQDHINGLLVPNDDVNALYLAMKEVIENPDLAEKMSQNAYKIRNELNPDIICGKMLQTILGNEYYD